ncbi:MAG: acetyltransferase, partial [Ramlibacter sp.]
MEPEDCTRVTHFDVFNGDADGLCARQQLRLAGAPGGVAVTGVKR